MRVCNARRPTAYRLCFMSAVALSYRTLSGSAEAPATGAAFFLPRHPVKREIPSATRHMIRPGFNFVFSPNASDFLRQRPVGCVLHGPDGLGDIRSMENGGTSNKNFGARSNQFCHVFRPDAPIDFDPEGMIIALSNSFKLANLSERPRNEFLPA